MILVRSPTLTFAFVFTILSISLTITTVTIDQENLQNPLRFLIILPPLNCLFIFLFSATWIERLFRLSYIPFISLVILFCSSLTIAIISGLFLSISIVVYLNLIFYSLCSIFFLTILIVVSISYAYGSLFIHRYRNMMTVEQRSSDFPENLQPLGLDSIELEPDLHLFMSKLPGRRIRHDIRKIKDDLEQINVHTIISLNEPKELSFMDMTNKNPYSMEIYSSHVKRANIEHLIYPIRDRFIPKSVSNYIEFLYTLLMNIKHSNHNRILIHCMGGMGRTGMTVVCLELMYEYLIKNNNQPERKQNILERCFHYPLLLSKSCRVCQAIRHVRQARKGTIHNPLQIAFVHEFYARLQSASYMYYIKEIRRRNEALLLNNQDFFSTFNPLAI